MPTSSEFDQLLPYLNQLRHCRALTREEECELGRQAQSGNRHAREELARNNLPFVVAVVKKHLGRGARLDDLIQEGNLGLLKAIEHFEPERGNRFATYAIWWIRAYVKRYLHDNRSQVRGGEKTRGPMRDLSLESIVENTEEVSHLDRLIGEAPGPEDEFLSEEHRAEIQAALTQVKKRLGDLGWDIVQQRLSQEAPTPLEEIGRKRGVSRERVRQVELKTKRFLKCYLAPIAA